MSIQLTKVRIDKVVACMTCPLCNKLLEEATTISLCLHTFCRKCIYEKFSDDECDSCPVCEVNLGCNPVDKLRPDHNLQDIRAKIFPIEKPMVEVPEAVPSVSPPIKRKERSLSSLVVESPRVPAHAGITGRRTRVGSRKSSTPSRSSPPSEASKKAEDVLEEENDEEPSSPETLNKIVQNKKQQLSASAKSSNTRLHGEESENRKEKDDMWKSLNFLVEVANRSKFSKSSLQGPSHVKAEPSNASDPGIYGSKADVEQNGHILEIRDDKNIASSSVSGTTKRKNRLRAANKNATASPADSSNPLQLAVEASNQLRPSIPIWFSLVASKQQEGTDPLPQIPANYLRIKNGDMPVSSIQKYIAKKLDISNDGEVEIMCQGQPVLPTLQLRSLLELWLTTTHNPSRRIKTTVGSSGKDYVMVLTYGRKVQAQTLPCFKTKVLITHEKDEPLDADANNNDRTG